MKLDEIIIELKKYDKSICMFYHTTNMNEIKILEQRVQYLIPNDFKRFLLISSGVNINCHELYGIKNDVPAEDLFENYIFETKEAGNPMPDFMLPIYPDGMGNHNCLDLKGLSKDGETCNVVFWQHDRFYKPDEQPDIDANSFTEYLEILLKELAEQYNYDGTEK